MSWLIDAERLIDDIENNGDKAIIDMIEAQPTAYDVDAVVNELEEYREENKHEVNSGFIDVCIDIVRKGGVK